MLDSIIKKHKPVRPSEEIGNEAHPPPAKFSTSFHHFAGYLQIDCVDNILPPEWLENVFNWEQCNNDIIGEKLSWSQKQTADPSRCRFQSFDFLFVRSLWVFCNSILFCNGQNYSIIVSTGAINSKGVHCTIKRWKCRRVLLHQAAVGSYYTKPGLNFVKMFFALKADFET